MKSNIFRLEVNNIIKHEADFNFNCEKPFEEQWIKLIESRYIDKRFSLYDNIFLHIYYAYIEKKITIGDYAVSINIIFNFASKHHLYIDYLYYKRVINEFNFIIFIDRKYLIEIHDPATIGYRNLLFIKEEDNRYNKETHKSIFLMSHIVHEYNK